MSSVFSRRTSHYAHRCWRKAHGKGVALSAARPLVRRVQNRPAQVQVLLPVPELPATHLRGAPWGIQAYLGRVEEVQCVEPEAPIVTLSLWQLPSGVPFTAVVPGDSIHADPSTPNQEGLTIVPGDLVYLWTWIELPRPTSTLPVALEERTLVIPVDHRILTQQEQVDLRQLLATLEGPEPDDPEDKTSEEPS